ncbi:unnamed protein product [Brachionus calyciflorus]|uniref:DNA-directed DNA polymerase n=1 Tax=Brachionus calyciflorus TaxID=104777 RepID=A0A813YG40_9BILA|nr:unnamed protein product [Brachionus calyciflorus]
MTLSNKLEEILKKWKFPQTIIENYKSIGIKEIFDWQAECLSSKKVSDERGNLVYSAPTSAGKTLVAELLMLKNVLDLRRKAIVILPFVSLAKEKLNHLQFILSESYLKADGFIGSTSPSGGFSTVDIAVCTIEKANSLLNRLIDDDQIFEIGVIVIDELHMVNDTGRGYLLELILSKIKYLCLKSGNKSRIQLIGMSATLPNLKVVADWLDASLYQTDYRPIKLIESIKFEDKIYDKDNQLISTLNIDKRIENDTDLLVQLVYETIVNKLGVLVFSPTKSRCETLAENIARGIYYLEKNHNEKLTFLNKEKIIECLNELKNTPAGLDPQLGKTIRYGIAFHHAGLTVEEREIVENYFRDGYLLVIVCTSTLSSGINFPARRVIIRTPVFNGRPIDIMSYKQMSGRAGRKGKDTLGESILMCANLNEKKIAENLLNSEIPELVTSEAQKELSSSIKRALLETIVSGVASRKKEIIDYVKCFLSHSLVDDLGYEKYLKWLNSNQFLDIVSSNSDDENYKSTQLGYAVVGSAMSPDEGLVIFSELQKAMQCFVLENELHIIYQITPINISDYWIHSSTSVDWNFYFTLMQNFSPDVKRVSDLVGVRQSFVLKMIKGCSMSSCDQRQLRIHLRFFTSLILNDLVNEVPFATILNKYGCQKGFLQSLQQSSSTYASMITVFCNRLGWFNLEILVNQFHSRLMFGVQRQLLDLIRIKLLNSNRARLFYNAGCTTVASIAMCDLKKIEKILRSGISFIGKRGHTNPNEQQINNSELVIWHDGKGYTYWEASAIIYQEANDLLRADLENLGVKISTEKSELNSELNKTQNLKEKSIFQFNETIDSILQSQNKSVNEKEIVKTEIQNSPLKEEIFKQEKESDINQISEYKTKQELIETGIQKIDLNSDFKSTQIDTENLNTQSNPAYKSFFDDQCILEVAEKFEKNIQMTPKSFKKPLKPVSQKHATPKSKLEEAPKNSNLNTTIVSEDVLLMCDIFEKNLSAKKPQKSIKKEPSENLKKSLNFSFGDTTLKNILNSSIDELNQEEKNFEHDLSQIKEEIVSMLKKLDYSNQIKTNVIDDINILETFANSIKPKTVVSISLACQEKSDNKENISQDFFEFKDSNCENLLRIYGIFICLGNERQKNVNFILFKKDGKFMPSLKKILERDDIVKIVFYSKKHFKIFNKAFEMSIKSPCYDPIIASWLLNQELISIYQIKQKYCPNLNLLIDSNFKNKKNCFGCSNNKNSNDEEFLSVQGAFLECLIGINCFEKIKLQLQLQNVWIYFAKIESEIVLLSSQIELIGFGLDLDNLEMIKAVLIKKKKEIEDKVFGLTGKMINLNSTDDVSYLLYNVLKLNPDSNERKNSNSRLKSHSTSKNVLKKLTSQHEVPGLVILWRKIQHSLSNSIFPIEKTKEFIQIIEMYRIFPTIDLYTATGRMNFYNPCLQNIPRDFEIESDRSNESLNIKLNELTNDVLSSEGLSDEEASFFLNKLDDETEPVKSKNSVSIRGSFIPCKGRILLSADYCQLELRIITNLCQDAHLINIFNDTRYDVFNLLASKWLNVSIEEIDEEKRQNVKKVIYGIIYGISAKTLSTFLNQDENEASNFIESFQSTFPGLKKFIKTQVENCRLKGYVETIRKRRRLLPNISSMEMKQKAQAERQAINTIIQGSASDIVKSAMVKIDKILKKKYSITINDRFDRNSGGAFMVMQLHDELIYEVNEQYLDDVKLIIKDCMENCMDLPVKMKAKIRAGLSWGSLDVI